MQSDGKTNLALCYVAECRRSDKGATCWADAWLPNDPRPNPHQQSTGMSPKGRPYIQTTQKDLILPINSLVAYYWIDHLTSELLAMFFLCKKEVKRRENSVRTTPVQCPLSIELLSPYFVSLPPPCPSKQMTCFLLPKVHCMPLLYLTAKCTVCTLIWNEYKGTQMYDAVWNQMCRTAL